MVQTNKKGHSSFCAQVAFDVEELISRYKKARTTAGLGLKSADMGAAIPRGDQLILTG